MVSGEPAHPGDRAPSLSGMVTHSGFKMKPFKVFQLKLPRLRGPKRMSLLQIAVLNRDCLERRPPQTFTKAWKS